MQNQNQNQEVIKFIFKSKIYEAQMRFDLLGSISQEVARALFISHQYEIKCDVNINVFDSFIKYWTEKKKFDDEINVDNFVEYEELNEEIQLNAMKQIIDQKKEQFNQHVIYLRKLQKSTTVNRAYFVQKIATNLDFYVKEYGEELISLPIQIIFNIFNHPTRKLKEHNLSYELIKKRYEQDKNIQIFLILPSLEYDKLNKENQRDSLIMSENRNGLIPKNSMKKIIEEKDEYEEKLRCNQKEIKDQAKTIRILTKCAELLFILVSNKLIPNDNEFCLSYISAFMTLENITKKIMSQEYNEIDIDDMEQNILPEYEDENHLIFRLNRLTNTASLCYSPKASGDIIIPRSIYFESNEYIINRIQDRFDCSNSIKSISFTEDCEIKTLYEKTFCNRYMHIEKITLPDSIIELEDGWCQEIPINTKIFVSEKNKNFKNLENGMIVGKSNYNQKNFDILYFVPKYLTEVTIPNFIKEIAPYCFYESNLQKINFEENSSLEIIGKFAFNSNSLEKFLIPKHVKVIEFGGLINDNLKTIEFSPDSELRIMKKYSCLSDIEHITLPSNLTRIEKKAFKDCTELKTIDFFPKSQLYFIGSKAFKNTKIEKLVIPESVSILDDGWCYDTSPNIKIIVSKNNKYFKNIENGLIVGKSDENNEDFDILYFVPRDIIEITIPDNIIEIASDCFNNCRKLNNILFTVQSKLEKIGNRSFMYCNMDGIPIKDFSIPKHVNTIGVKAFYLFNIQNIIFPSDSELITICQNAFEFSPIEYILIPLHVKRIEKYAFCKSHLKKIEFVPKSELLYIGEWAFYDSQIEQIDIPCHVLEIADDAFSCCTKLKTVRFSKDSELKYIGKCSFKYISIEYIKIPSQVKKIQDSVFHSCDKLKTIEFDPDSDLRTIDKDAFFACKIERIIIHPQMKKIDNSTLSNFEQYISQKG